MLFNLVTIPLLGLLGTAAAFSPEQEYRPFRPSNATNLWTVTDYSVTLDYEQKGFSYYFHIHGNQVNPVGPSFDTHCRGFEPFDSSDNNGNPLTSFVACEDDLEVSSRLYQGGVGNIALTNVQVKHKWNLESYKEGVLATYAVVGNYTYLTEGVVPKTFNITEFSDVSS